MIGQQTVQSCRAFTLIEVMMTVLLMALLASAAALSFSGPLRSARAADAQDQIRSFDAAARDMARHSHREVRLVFDLSGSTLARREGPELQDLRSRVSLPAGCRVTQLCVAGQSFEDGEAVVDFSSLGIGRSYAIHLSGAGLDRWLLIAGLSGQMTQVQDEVEAQSILGRAAPMAYRSWDGNPRNDAD
jgi:prepilin-type N-terminal cleavage/methylation domain-containing protein